MYMLITIAIIWTFMEILIRKNGWEPFPARGMTISLTGVIAMITMLLIYKHNPAPPDTWIKTHEHSLVAIRNGDTVKGSFFLGTGNVNGREVYICYKKLKSGGITQVTLNPSTVVIFEDSSKEPCVQHWRAFHWPKWAFCPEHPKSVRITVPEGSIVRKFEVK